MTRLRFEDILRNLHFMYSKEDDKSYQVRSLIDHFNQSFNNFVINDDSKSIDKHMPTVKFNSRSSIT